MRYRANIGWDGGTAGYFHMTEYVGPVVIEAASEIEARALFQVMLDTDAETNVDRYDGDVESINVEEVS